MNTDELRAYVKDLPEEIKGRFVKKEFRNQPKVISESIEDFFSGSNTVAEIKEFFAKFDDEAIVDISANYESGYYEEDEGRAELEAKVVLHRIETDDELTDRILSKVKNVEKQVDKEKAAKDLVRKNIKLL